MNLSALIVLSTFWVADPAPIRGIYLNPNRAMDRAYLKNVLTWADSGYINTIVVDLKSDLGLIVFPSENEIARKIKAVRNFINLDTLIRLTEEHNVKLIARLVIFKDNQLARYKNYGIRHRLGCLWRDDGRNFWVNPYLEEVWDYNISIIEELLKKGIKSIQLDYVRFPTDGDLKACRYSKIKGSREEAISNFLERVQKVVKREGGEVGVCVFGYSIWTQLKQEGQNIEKMAKYIDYLYPMLYPSHFSQHFKKEIDDIWRSFLIYYESTLRAIEQVDAEVKVVPYIQGFNYIAPQFGSDYIFTQIFGALLAGAEGFIVWNARGAYRSSTDALCWARTVKRARPVLIRQGNHMKNRPDQGLERDWYIPDIQFPGRKRVRPSFQGGNQTDNRNE